MSHRTVALSLLVVAGVCSVAAQTGARLSQTPYPYPSAAIRQEMPSLSPEDVARLEGLLSSHPEDMQTRSQLLSYYSSPAGNDSEWSNRLRLLTWAVENHPESAAVAQPQFWMGMPDAVFQQLKPLWIAQVHQHAEDYKVLMNAAVFLGSRNTQQGPSGIRVGGNVAAANLIKSVPPQYPALAQQARIQGTVRFNVTIGTDGHIQNLQLISGHPLLVQAAQDALQQYLYKPTLLNGNPVSVTTTVDINFALNQ